jgi:hypothetical protein
MIKQYPTEQSPEPILEAQNTNIATSSPTKHTKNERSRAPKSKQTPNIPKLSVSPHPNKINATNVHEMWKLWLENILKTSMFKRMMNSLVI